MNLSALFPIAAAAFAIQTGQGQDTAAVARQIDAMSPKLEAIYKDLHAHPELAFQETRTAAKLAAEMRAIGFEVTEKVGKTGLVAIYRNGAGPTVLVRTELDGQLNGKDSPVAHSDGHDVHMASWLGTARALVALQPQWKGTLVFIAQPAEEIGGGARAMLADGLFTRFPKPDFAIALHAWPLAAGTIGYDSAMGSSNAHGTVAVLKQAFGDANVARVPAMSASENFSAFVNEGVPSMFFYAPVNEPSIKTGAEAMSLAVLNVMARP